VISRRARWASIFLPTKNSQSPISDFPIVKGNNH
jgi:hypothetical protein